MDDTSAVRIATGNNNFKFNKSDGFRYISTRDLLYSLPLTTIKAMVEESNEGKKRADRIAVTNKSKSQLVRALMELEEVNDLVMKYAYKDAATRIDEEDEELEPGDFDYLDPKFFTSKSTFYLIKKNKNYIF